MITHIPQFLFFASWMIIFALVRPAMVRDYEGRRLPTNLKARVIIAFMYVLIYATLVVGLALFGQILEPILDKVPKFESLLKSLDLAAPFYAFFTLSALWQIHFFSEIDRAFLVSLHTSRNFQDNVDLLSSNLLVCEFVPSKQELNRYLDELNQQGVHITDTEGDRVGRIIVHNWRKVSTLLRLIKLWNEDEFRALSTDDMETYEDLHISHRRKTTLALDIIKLLEQAGKETDSGNLFSTLQKVLKKAPDLRLPEAIEAYLESTLSGQAGAGSTLTGQAGAGSTLSIELTPDQFASYVHQIEQYFESEYRSMLQEAALLAARSIVLSGSARFGRLQQLKEVGCGGIGYFSHVSVDRMIWIFLSSSLVGYLIMVHGIGGNSRAGLARFAITMAVAALVGAVVGSARVNARSAEPRWTVYVAAGLFSSILYLGFTALQNAVINDFLSTPAETLDWEKLLPARSVPFSILQLTTTVAIAYLARHNNWHVELKHLSKLNAFMERFIDGI
jgi:hypothetical protein